MAIWGIAVVISLGVGSNAYALPEGGMVAGGAASIAGTKGAVTIGQSSQNAVINWQSFGIGKGEAVTFQQPNSTSVALNRVLGADPSRILGSLSANGQVFLVNPNGILFGHGRAGERRGAGCVNPGHHRRQLHGGQLPIRRVQQ